MAKRACAPENISAPARSEGAPAAVPAVFDDAVVWAAWLYYADQLNQSDVAKAMNVSRATVVNLLHDARVRGVVDIRLRTDLVSRTTIARTLASRFGLVEAMVIPSRGADGLVDRLGGAAARLLGNNLRPRDVIGVAWGRTVLAAAKAMALTEAISPLMVVQVAGSSPASEDFSPELCTSLMSSRLGARCVNLLAPAVLSSAELRDRLMREPMLVHQFELIRSATSILFGVGDLGAASTLRKSGYVSAEIVARYVAAGAAGALIGRFIGADGRPIPGEMDERMIGLTLDELRAAPLRICVAGGLAKHQAIRAALAGGYATHFVTDLDTATKLLK